MVTPTGERSVMQQRAAERTRQVTPVDWYIETDSYVPYYQQIVEQIRGLIKAGRLREGEVFHSEGDVCRGTQYQ